MNRVNRTIKLCLSKVGGKDCFNPADFGKKYCYTHRYTCPNCHSAEIEDCNYCESCFSIIYFADIFKPEMIHPFDN